MFKISNRNYNRRTKRNDQSNRKKTEYEKQRTHEEVKQIKKKFIKLRKNILGERMDRFNIKSRASISNAAGNRVCR